MMLLKMFTENSNLGVGLGVVFLEQIYFIYNFNKLDSLLKD